MQPAQTNSGPVRGSARSRPQQIIPRFWQRPQNSEFTPREAARVILAVGIGPLGCYGVNLSEFAAAGRI
jgi:hypothetical protein